MQKKDLEQFRQSLYDYLPHRSATVVELVDSLASNNFARSPVELSLSPHFNRGHSSLYRAIEELHIPQQEDDWSNKDNFETDLVGLLSPYLPEPRADGFYLMAVDSTPNPHAYAKVMKDRKFIHQPTLIKGNKPISIGQEYSCVGLVVAQASGQKSARWFVPLSIREVEFIYRAYQLAAWQFEQLLTQPKLPFYEQLCVGVADTHYSHAYFIHHTSKLDHFIGIARLRGNRNLFKPLGACANIARSGLPGRKKNYGLDHKLNDQATWGQADQSKGFEHQTKKGRTFFIQVQCWNNLRMSGHKNVLMHHIPLRLIRITTWDTEGGEMVFKRPLYLIMWGKQALDLELKTIFYSYLERFDEEHFFRFAKQRLLMTKCQSPQPKQQQNWMWIVMLAHWSLFIARFDVEAIPRPWEKNLPTFKSHKKTKEQQMAKYPLPATPTLTQRGLSPIFSTFEMITPPPKPRGNSPGGKVGQLRRPKAKAIILKKSGKRAKTDSS